MLLPKICWGDLNEQGEPTQCPLYDGVSFRQHRFAEKYEGMISMEYAMLRQKLFELVRHVLSSSVGLKTLNFGGKKIFCHALKMNKTSKNICLGF